MRTLDFILIHGYGLENGEVDRNVLAPRLDLGAVLFLERAGDYLIVAGKHGGDDGPDREFVERTGITEARRMKEYLLRLEVPEDRVVEESEGTNTWDCTKFAYEKIIKPKVWTSGHIVTSYEHLPRTALQTAKMMPLWSMAVVFHGTPIFDLRLREEIFREEVEKIRYTLSKG